MSRLFQFLRYSLGPSPLPAVPDKFLIVFLSRTGSNLLAARLSTHPDVLCHHELYNPNGIHRALRYKGSDLSFGTMDDRARDPWAFAGRVYAFTGGARTVGFKLSPGQENWLLLSLLLNRKVRKIVLRRRQLLEAYASDKLATLTGEWSRNKNAPGGTAAPKKAYGPITAEPAEFIRFVRKRKLFYRLVAIVLTITGQRGLFLDYEELSDTNRIRDVLRFLGVSDDVPLADQTEKQNPETLEQRIGNYPELKQALAGTAYAEFCP